MVSTQATKACLQVWVGLESFPVLPHIASAVAHGVGILAKNDRPCLICSQARPHGRDEAAGRRAWAWAWCGRAAARQGIRSN